MSSPFVAEITMYPFNFAPKGWAFCNGQLMPISQNTALFSLLGTMYGGDGKSTFGLPDLPGQACIGQGQSPGTSQYFVGETVGTENVTLLTTEMPAHNHGMVAQSTQRTVVAANGNMLSKGVAGSKSASFTASYLSTNAPNTPMLPATSTYGSSFPHNNMQPYLTLNFCIALQGVFPARP
jgi:microcystin-dependent protein